jgi:hypothetical protein
MVKPQLELMRNEIGDGIEAGAHRQAHRLRALQDADLVRLIV